jgi:hypothetical protein
MPAINQHDSGHSAGLLVLRFDVLELLLEERQGQR